MQKFLFVLHFENIHWDDVEFYLVWKTDTKHSIGFVCKNVFNEEIHLYRAMERNSITWERDAVVDPGFSMGRGS